MLIVLKKIWSQNVNTEPGGRGGGGKEKMRHFHQCVNVPRVLTGVVGSLSEEVKKLKQVIEISERAKTRERNRERCEGGEDRRSWCVDLDQRCVRKKFQIYLADVIVNEKHRPDRGCTIVKPHRWKNKEQQQQPIASAGNCIGWQ